MVRLSLRHRPTGRGATAMPSSAAQPSGMLQLSPVHLCPVWSWVGATPAPGSELGAVFLLMPLSFQPTKERLWDKPSYRKPSSASLKAPLQFDSRAPLHPERGPGKNPCCPPCSRHQLSSAADLRGICHGHTAHWWCRSSLRPTSSPNRTYLWFCLSAVCFQMPQTLGMAKATQSPWKT